MRWRPSKAGPTTPVTARPQRGTSTRAPLKTTTRQNTSRTRSVVDDFQAAQSALEGFKHATAADLVKAGFQQATLLHTGVQEPAAFNRLGLAEVVLEYQNPEGARVREAGLLRSVFQNHVTLLQGPDLLPRTFVNTFANHAAAVPFTALFVRDTALEQVKGWDARRLIAGQAPSVVWFHYPEPDTGEPRFIFGRVTPCPEHVTVTTPDGRHFKFHPDFLDELAKQADFSASPLLGALPRPVPVSRGVPPAGLIGQKTEVSTPYTAAPTQHQAQVHERITHALFNGAIELVGSLHLGVVWKVKLHSVDPTTGERVVSDAVMKARVPGDKRMWSAPDETRGYGRAPLEYVGYFINRLLKMDVVPPVAYRRGLSLQLPDGHVVTEAALIHFVPNLKTHLSTLPLSSDAKVHARVLRDPDLSGFNYGTGEHWVDGRLHDVRFDLSAAGSNMPGTGRAGPGITSIRRTVHDALRAWTVNDLQPLIEADFITAGEAESYIENGSWVLRHIDRLVEQAKSSGVDVATIITPD